MKVFSKPQNFIPCRGFSFVEVIAAVVILEVLTLSVLQMYSFGKRTSAIVQEDLILANLFQWKIEDIKGRKFTNDVSGSGQSVTGFTGYQFDVVQTVPYQGNTYLKKVDVTCRWISAMGNPKQQTMSFLVADH